MSFRVLFVQPGTKTETPNKEEHQHLNNHQDAGRRGWQKRARHMYDSLLDTFKTMEGYSGDSGSVDTYGLPVVPSGLMTVDFNDDASWGKSASSHEGFRTDTTVTQAS